MECDFCSNPKVVKRYQCMDFNAESKDAGVLAMDKDGVPTNVVLHSMNYWAACEACAKLVDANDLEGLVKHATETLNRDRSMSPIAFAFFVQHTRHSYTLFFQNRIRVVYDTDVHDQR